METKLGKIKKVYFGHGGYQDACIGIHFTLGGDGWGVTTTESAWDLNMISCSEYCKWTEKDRSEQYDEIVRFISNRLREAKVSSVDELEGIPVECDFENHTLKDWRILEEVL